VAPDIQVYFWATFLSSVLIVTLSVGVTSHVLHANGLYLDLDKCQTDTQRMSPFLDVNEDDITTCRDVTPVT